MEKLEMATSGGADGLCCPPLTGAPLGEEDATELARVLSALADPVRLRLVSLVAANGEVCSCDLEQPLGRSQPTISHHTRVLVEAGLLTGKKRGRWTWWSLVPGRLAQVRAALGDEPRPPAGPGSARQGDRVGRAHGR